MIDSFDQIFGNKSKVMVVFAHPDDAELYSGGTIARLISSGKSVRVVKMTSGNKGSRGEKISEKDLFNLREKEDREAMKVLGIKDEDNVYLRIGDGEITNSLEIIGKIAQQIRLFQPDLVISHNSEDVVIKHTSGESWINHRDHRNTGLSVIDATYPYARDLLFFSEHFTDPRAKSHAVTEYLIVDSYGHPDEIAIEMTDFVETRVNAHACHSSQYSKEAAQESADFFTLEPDGKRYEKFRYVKVD
ncbi:MAG: PIG-L deacetylase family protein [Candidatus Amesbacteria bacterium]|nr:PIG-L deacetylase family protein [Candidatus Amesbacteria bacterium]